MPIIDELRDQPLKDLLGPNAVVFVIDDNQDNAKPLARLLSIISSIETRVALNLEDARKMFEGLKTEGKHVGAIITDDNMGDGRENGADFAKKANNTGIKGLAKHTPVLLFSGAIEHTGDHVITKASAGANPEAIIALLRQFLIKQRLAESGISSDPAQPLLNDADHKKVAEQHIKGLREKLKATRLLIKHRPRDYIEDEMANLKKLQHVAEQQDYANQLDSEIKEWQQRIQKKDPKNPGTGRRR